jgi:enoyl-CoA hydratase/3-hydroxyacyl-CoA dehydrogenase
MSSKVTLEVIRNVAVVTIDYPPVNALHTDVYAGVSASMARINSDPEIKAAVLTGKGSSFIAGADIKAFGDMFNHPEEEVVQSMYKSNMEYDGIEKGPKPWVAAINGVAFGGGLEFAMLCSHRLCIPKTLLGLPELTLGLLPGLGGTQRLPRLIGVQNAVKAMLESQNIPAPKAHKMGLVDGLVEPAELINASIQLALDIASGAKPRQYSLKRTDKLENSMMIGQIIKMAGQMATKKSPHMPQALACLRAIEAGLKPGDQGRMVESREFTKLGQGPVSKALIHVFLSQRACSKVKGLGGLKPRQIKCAAVVGGGLMGSGIATVLVQAGVRVLLKEINQQFLDAGVGRIKANLDNRVKKGRLTADKAAKMMSLVVPVLTYDQFREADIVIEAVIEKLELKQSVFVDLERACRPDCILATNTSTINIDKIGAKTKSAERIIGAHFFSPAHVMPLLEIVVSDQTSKQVVADLLGLAKRIRKTPVVAGNCPGFVVNRTFFPYTTSALFLAEHGVDPYEIDRVIKQFGMPMGPFRLQDLVGVDIGLFTSVQYLENYPERVYKAETVKMMVDSGRLGEKTGKGWYTFDGSSRKEKKDPEIAGMMESLRVKAGRPKFTGLSDKDITEITFLPVINEACRIVSEGYCDKASDLDIASLFGMGFPAHLGGPLHWGDHLTGRYIVQRLEHFRRTFGHEMFKPCDFLLARASAGIPLSAPVDTFKPSDNDVVIVAAARTAIGRAKKGGFNNTPIDDLLAVVIKKALQDAQPLKAEEVGDVVVGTVLGSSAALQARTGMLLAGMPNTVPVRTVNRQCSSGLQAIVDVAAAVKAGLYDVGIACGAESMSMNSMMPKDFKANPNALSNPAVASSYMPMGQTSENVAKKFGVSRETQDKFAVESHAKAAKAIKQGKLSHIVPVATEMVDAKTKEKTKVTVTMDEGVREGTTVQDLAKLRPAFAKEGTTTAGNSSQMSDGAAAVIVMSRRKAAQLGLKPLAVLRSYYVGGCDPAIMGVGPAVAIPPALERAGLTADQVDVFEINEAFASQATYCVDKLGIDYNKVNPNGGAIAIGHPLGMTGARMTVDLIHELQRRGGGNGIVSMCIGTGMGAAAVWQVPPQ